VFSGSSSRLQLLNKAERVLAGMRLAVIRWQQLKHVPIPHIHENGGV